MFDQAVTSGPRPAIDDAVGLIAGCAFGAVLAAMTCELIIAMLVLVAIHLLKRACRRTGLGGARRLAGDHANIPRPAATGPMPQIAGATG